MPQAPASHGVVAVAEVSRGERDEQRKGRGGDSGGVQPDPVLAELDEQRRGRDGEHECDQQQRDAVGDDRRQHDQRDQHQQAEVLRIPAPSQGQAAAADHRREHQADGRGDPVVDRGDRDDVHVRRRNTGRGQGDRADPPARAGVQPSRDADERPGQQSACADTDFRPQDARLGGEHEQQHDADQRDGDTGDGEDLADPARVARRPRRLRRRRRASVAVAGGGRCGGGGYGAAGGGYGCAAGIGGGTGCGATVAATDVRSASSRSSSVRSAETRVSCWDIAANSAESRVTTA